MSCLWEGGGVGEGEEKGEDTDSDYWEPDGYTYLFEAPHHLPRQLHVLEHPLQLASEVGSTLCQEEREIKSNRKMASLTPNLPTLG